MILIIKTSFSSFQLNLDVPFTCAKLREAIGLHLCTPATNILIYENGKVVKDDVIYNNAENATEKEFVVKLIMVPKSCESFPDSSKSSHLKTGYGPDEDDDPPFFESMVTFIVNLGFSKKQAKETLRKSISKRKGHPLTSAIQLLSKTHRVSLDDIIVNRMDCDFYKKDDNAEWSDLENISLFKKRVKFMDDWEKISSSFPGKTLQQVRGHWHNYFSRKLNNIKTSLTPKEVWTNEETEMLYFCYFGLGKNFSKVKHFFPSKTQEELSMYWEEILVPSLERDGRRIDYYDNDDVESVFDKDFNGKEWSEDDDQLIRITIKNNGNDPLILKHLFANHTDEEIQDRIAVLYGERIPTIYSKEQYEAKSMPKQTKSSSTTQSTSERKVNDDFTEYRQRSKTYKWTDDENDLLLDLYDIFHNNWSKFSKYFPGRTTNGISQHHSVITRKGYVRKSPKGSHLKNISISVEVENKTPKAAEAPNPINAEKPIEAPKPIEKAEPKVVQQTEQIVATPTEQKVIQPTEQKVVQPATQKVVPQTEQKVVPQTEHKIVQPTTQKVVPQAEQKTVPQVIRIEQNPPRNIQIDLPHEPQKFKSLEKDAYIFKNALLNDLCWAKMSRPIPGFSERSLRERWNTLKKRYIEKFNPVFTEQEDVLLFRAVKEFKGDITKVAPLFPGKDKEALMYRYDDLLKPKLEKYTPEEDELLLKLVDQYGKSWIKISNYFKNRTCRSLNRHYQTLMLKKKKDDNKLGSASDSHEEDLSAEHKQSPKKEVLVKQVPVVTVNNNLQKPVKESNQIIMPQQKPAQNNSTLNAPANTVPYRPRRTWSDNDISNLINLYDRYHGRLGDIAVYFKNATEEDCRLEWNFLHQYDPHHVDDSSWTFNEVDLLKKMILNGKYSWINMSAPFMKTKSAYQIIKKISAIKEELTWSEKMDNTLREKYKSENGNWTKIAAFFPQKTLYLVKCRWERLGLK